MSDELEPLDTGALDVREDHQHRKAEIMRLRRGAATFEAIGRAVGLSRQRVHQIYREALAEIPVAEVKAYRQEQGELLDALQEKALEVLAKKHITVSNGKVVTLDGQVVEDDGPTLDAIKTVLAIEERRAKLLGLDTPVKQEVAVDGGIVWEIVGVAAEVLK